MPEKHIEYNQRNPLKINISLIFFIYYITLRSQPPVNTQKNMSYPEDQITTVSHLLVSEIDNTLLRNSLSVNGMSEIIENHALSVNDLLIHEDDHVCVLSVSYASQIVAAYNAIKNSEAYISGAISLRDMMIISEQYGHTNLDVLSVSFARQVAENPERLQEVHNIILRPENAMMHHTRYASLGFFNHQQQDQQPEFELEITNAMRLEMAEYSGEIHREFICPITHQIMDEPVSIPGSNQSFERSALHEWLSIRGTNPLNPGQTITHVDIQTATSIRDQINEFVSSVSPQTPQQCCFIC
ncbi:MAG: hypothetical protein CL816_06205 [Coxiellaceae bacterium]|nr:hypothetical protein [Coxiellaceae bacterium]|tara:strand:+ start:148 stop:1044 length:897 start_codon:yes stop_codon:yes gene_type:complete